MVIQMNVLTYITKQLEMLSEGVIVNAERAGEDDYFEEINIELDCNVSMDKNGEWQVTFYPIIHDTEVENPLKLL